MLRLIKRKMWDAISIVLQKKIPTATCYRGWSAKWCYRLWIFSSMKVSKYIHTLCIIWFTHNFQFCLAGFSRLKPSTTKINWQTVWVRNSNAIVLRPGTCCIVFVSYKSSRFICRFRQCPTDLSNLSTFFICMFVMSSKQEMPQCISKVRNTHEHHLFMYSYASYHDDMCPH